MSKVCVLVGDRSDLAKALLPFLEADGWLVRGWNRDSKCLPGVQWDLFLCALGRVAPVGNWWKQSGAEVNECFQANLLVPLGLLQAMWSRRNAGASVCFMGGSNPQKIMPGYLAYNCAKMSLLKAVEQIDHESQDAKVFCLGPGYVKTKIHNATLAANWPNERIARGDDGTPIERIYGCLKWCISQNKAVVGGRQICASDPWDQELNRMAITLLERPDMFKLRRIE